MRARTSLRRRIVVPTALLGLVAVAAVAWLAWNESAQGRALARRAEEVRAATALAFELAEAAHEESRAVAALRSGRAAAQEARIAGAAARIGAEMGDLGSLRLAPRAAAVWTQYLENRAVLEAIRGEALASARRGDAPGLALAVEKWRLVSTRGGALLQNLTAYHLRLLDRTVEDLQRSRERALRGALAALVAAALGAAAFSVVLGRAVVRPIVEMADAAAHVTEHGPASPVPGGDRDDELGVLARSLNEMAARLVLAVRARDEFISIASHELKTPLTPLRLRVQQLLRVVGEGEGPVPRERLERAAGDLDRHVGRFTKLVENLLDVSQISAGRLALREVRPTALSVVIADALERAGDDLAAAGCAVRLECEPGVAARVDRGRLEQVLVNLLTNVAKYAPGAPAVVRCARDGAGVVRLEVEDGGPGVDAAHHDRIFSRFERAVDDPRAVAGLGLGLYIAREIARAHGGELTLRHAPSGGALFVVRLPAATAAGEPPSAGEAEGERAG
jgi:signal transduction histidine kinase